MIVATTTLYVNLLLFFPTRADVWVVTSILPGLHLQVLARLGSLRLGSGTFPRV